MADRFVRITPKRAMKIRVEARQIGVIPIFGCLPILPLLVVTTRSLTAAPAMGSAPLHTGTSAVQAMTPSTGT
jgi:hypothetical protein